jgi:hypothetical protein
VKPIIENKTSPAEVAIETESSILRTPNTVQGCLPISVKIQPVALATYGKPTPYKRTL